MSEVGRMMQVGRRDEARVVVLRALVEEGGHVGATAGRLGISQTFAWYVLRELGLVEEGRRLRAARKVRFRLPGAA